MNGRICVKNVRRLFKKYSKISLAGLYTSNVRFLRLYKSYFDLKDYQLIELSPNVISM